MNKRRAYLFVVPWSPTDVGGVNQVVLNLYHQFEAGGVFTPRILVTSWDSAKSSKSEQKERSVAYMRLRPPFIPSAPLASITKWAVCLLPALSRLDRYLRASDVANVNVH